MNQIKNSMFFHEYFVPREVMCFTFKNQFFTKCSVKETKNRRIILLIVRFICRFISILYAGIIDKLI